MLSTASRVLFVLLCAAPLMVAAQEIAIVYPAGGETFTVGDLVTIQWTGGVSNWSMMVSIIDVNAWQVFDVLAEDADNTGSFPWVVNAPSGLYQVYVQGNRNEPDSMWAYGQSFTVYAPPTEVPTAEPTVAPTAEPTVDPTPEPTPVPPTPIPPTPIPPTPIPPTPIPPTPAPPTPVPHPGGCAWISNPTQASCPSWCTWNCALKLCYDAYCAQLATPAQCGQVSGCTWANNKCRDYNLQYGTLTNCALATSAAVCGGTQCQWSSYQNACIQGYPTGACAWLPQQSAKACPTERCTFSPSIGYCYDQTCSLKVTAGDCASQGGCTWYNGYCYDYNLQYSGFACSKAAEVAECPASRCHWDGTACLSGAGAPVILAPAPHPGGCAWVSNPTAATCPAHCTFDANLNICYDAKCPLLHSPAACGSVSGCTWSRNVCRDYNLHYGTVGPCDQSTSPTTCGGFNCDWSYKQNKCLSVSSNSACAWLPQNNVLTCPDRCSFSASLGFCYNAQCIQATNECGCSLLSSGACSWYNGRCLDYNVHFGSYACSSATNQATCGRNCVWNAASSTCSQP